MTKPSDPEGQTPFEPFADDAAVRTIGGLSIENGTDRIAIHGALDVTRDGIGLERARALAAVLSAMMAALEGEALPEKVAEASRAPRPVKNPFA